MDASDRDTGEEFEAEVRPLRQAGKHFFPSFATVRAALETGHIGIWSWDIASDKVTWSSNLETIHGMPLGSLISGYFATFIGAPAVIGVNGILLIAVAAYFLAWHPRVREA